MLPAAGAANNRLSTDSQRWKRNLLTTHSKCGRDGCASFVSMRGVELVVTGLGRSTAQSLNCLWRMSGYVHTRMRAMRDESIERGCR